MEKIKLNLEKPVAFYPELSRALGGALEALYVQQLYYWSDKGKRKDGWIYKTKKEMEEETTLTIRQQDRIRKNIEKQGILETKLLKANGSPTIHYKLNIPMLQKVILEYDETSHSNHTKRHIPLTENTTENTTEISPKGDTGEPESYGRKDINTCIENLKEQLSGTPDGTIKENRRFCKLLIGKFEKDYTDKDPTELIAFLIKEGLKDNFHGKNITSFKYLYYNSQKIIQSIKGRASNSKLIKIK